jgi:DNA-binding transcriptional LysR family regulator
MHWKDFDLNLLPVLDALLRRGSVSAAAEHLGLAQPAVSKALRRLRLYFGDPLFVRTGRGMAATPKAMELAPVVAQVMETARARLVPGAGFDAATSQRVFTLSMSDVAELVFLPTLLPRLQALAPQVTLRVVRVPPRDLDAALEQRNVDLALGSVRLACEGLFQQQLFRHPLACIASPRHPAAGGDLSLADYRAAGHIGVTTPGTEEDIFEWALQEHAVARRFVMFTPSFMVLPMLLAHGDLLATVPQRLADTFVGYGAVQAWPMPVPVAPLALRQTWHARFHHDPANAWLRQRVCELFQAAS